MGKSDPSDFSSFCVQACTSACSKSDYIFKQGAVTRPALGMQTAILPTALTGLQDLAFCLSSLQTGGLFMCLSTTCSPFAPLQFHLQPLLFLPKKIKNFCKSITAAILVRWAPDDHVCLSSLYLFSASSWFGSNLTAFSSGNKPCYLISNTPIAK